MHALNYSLTTRHFWVFILFILFFFSTMIHAYLERKLFFRLVFNLGTLILDPDRRFIVNSYSEKYPGHICASIILFCRVEEIKKKKNYVGKLRWYCGYQHKIQYTGSFIRIITRSMETHARKKKTCCIIMRPNSRWGNYVTKK